MLATMGCRDECPYVPGVKRDDWPLEDPKDQPIARVRAIRDDIARRVNALVQTVDLIRFGGRLPKGGYDVHTDGRDEPNEPASRPAIR